MQSRASNGAILSSRSIERALAHARRLGWRLEGHTLARDVRGSRHLLKFPPAIAYVAPLLDELMPDVDDFRVNDSESGQRYTISGPTFEEKREFTDRGFGAQWFVRLEHWDSTPPPGRL